MSEVAVRFASFGADGRSTDVWKIWANRGSGKRDVYMTSRPLGYSMKLSLHERGQWHVGFHSEKKDTLFDPGSAPQSRFLGKWDAPERVNGPPIILAARVIFPWSASTIVPRDHPEDLLRIPAAPDRQALEVAVFLLDHDETPDTWPGRDAMGTALLGRVPLDGGGGVTVVYHYIDMPSNGVPQSGSANYFAGKSKKDLHTANRLVGWWQADDGSVCFIEAPLEVQIPRVG